MRKKLVVFLLTTMVASTLMGCSIPFLQKDNNETASSNESIEAVNANTAVEGLQFNVGDVIYPDGLVIPDPNLKYESIVFQDGDGNESPTYEITQAGSFKTTVVIKYVDSDPVSINVKFKAIDSDETDAADEHTAPPTNLIGTPYELDFADGSNATFVEDVNNELGIKSIIQLNDTIRLRDEILDYEVSTIKPEGFTFPNESEGTGCSGMGYNSAVFEDTQVIIAGTMTYVTDSGRVIYIHSNPSTFAPGYEMWEEYVAAIQEGSESEIAFVDGLEKEDRNDLESTIRLYNSSLGNANGLSYLSSRIYDSTAADYAVSSADFQAGKGENGEDGEEKDINVVKSYQDEHPTYYQWASASIIYRRWKYIPDPDVDQQHMGTMMYANGTIIHFENDGKNNGNTNVNVYNNNNNNSTSVGDGKQEYEMTSFTQAVKINTVTEPTVKITMSNQQYVVMTNDQGTEFKLEGYSKAQVNTIAEKQTLTVKHDDDTKITVAEGTAFNSNIGEVIPYMVTYTLDGTTRTDVYFYAIPRGDKYLVITSTNGAIDSADGNRIINTLTE